MCLALFVLYRDIAAGYTAVDAMYMYKMGDLSSIRREESIEILEIKHKYNTE